MNFFKIILTTFFAFSFSKIITLKKNNFIAIDGEINNKNVNNWIRALNNVTTSVIYIYINSPGGSVDAGEILINQLNYKKFFNFSIECIAQKAYSMAFHILQTCDKRYITLSSKVMQHQISLSLPKNQLENILNYLEMLKQIRDSLEIMSSKRINISLEEYRIKITSDWWLYGENILLNNVADEIVFVGCHKELFNETFTKSVQYFDLTKFDVVKKEISYDSCPL